MKLRALVVEDDPDQLEGLALAFRSISEIERRRYGIDDIFVETADCTQVEREILEDASRSGQPFDILLQDLNLPIHPGGKETGVPVGLDLLKFAHISGAAKEIGVVSAFTDFDSVLTAFLRGAVDFIPKPCDPAYLLRRILQLWERRLMKESARIFEERFKILVPYAASEFSHLASSCFSTLAQTILQRSDGLKRILSERFGLDIKSDPQDSLLEQLSVIEQAVGEAQREWGKTKEIQTLFIKQLPEAFDEKDADPHPTNPLPQKDETPMEICIEDALHYVVSAVSSCLAFKQVSIEIPEGIPEEQKTQVISFGDDVRTVLSEIIIGGISELPDENSLSKDIKITVVNKAEKGKKAEVCLVDNLTPISYEKAEAINNGASLSPDVSFGRAWGLSVVHHMALRGGGHLNVEPTEQGNVITYFIPLTQNA
jgi:CheY-like chemotaxis protein